MVLFSISSVTFASAPESNYKSPTEAEEAQYIVSGAAGHHNHWGHDLNESSHIRCDSTKSFPCSLLPYRTPMPTFSATTPPANTASVVATIVIQLPSFDSLPDDLNTIDTPNSEHSNK